MHDQCILWKILQYTLLSVRASTGDGGSRRRPQQEEVERLQQGGAINNARQLDYYNLLYFSRGLEADRPAVKAPTPQLGAPRGDET